MRTPRIGVIVDNRCVAPWQAEALRTIAGKYDLLLYNCTNTRPARRRAKHALYYVLNLFTIRNRLTRSVTFPNDVPIVRETSFESGYEGTWQTLPKQLIERFAEDEIAALVKFGMGLLRIPNGAEFPPILSYHHGDPRHYRGRPAGFYEIAERADRLGQVVQLLTNDLDSGSIAAFGETRVHRHSYRATLIEAYRISPLLLHRAIKNALAGQATPVAKGPVYRLPANKTVAAFCAKLLWNYAKRLHYGALVEKRWQVAHAEIATHEPTRIVSDFPRPEHWTIEPIPAGYHFIADPFFHPAGNGILVEGLSKSSGLGEILHLDSGEPRRLTPSTTHWSYPATISLGNEHFVVPEIAESSPVRLFRLTSNALEPVPNFVVEGEPSLIDPTLFEHQGRFYLFGNRLNEAPSVLRLWTSTALRAPFVEHPASPVRISPAGSRMAGRIAVAPDGSLWRLGQDSTRDYGDGVLLFEIEQLSAEEYEEVERGRLRFMHVRGPHTVNFDESRALFDFYRNRTSPFAGLRRFVRLMALRRRGGTSEILGRTA